MTAESNHTALVIGHHHPDTDAVCSALVYASFYRWPTGRDAIPCYLDDLTPETARLLTYLGLGTPRDHTIAPWLEARSGQPIAALAHALFRARLPDPIPPASWWVNRDQPRAECESQLP